MDGQSQYIVYLRYTGQYLRNTVSGFLHGNFHPAVYDFSIGIGDDIGAIVRFHPLDLLSVFVPAACTEQLYAVILLLRMYLSGLAFSCYASSVHWFTGREAEKPASMINIMTGSLVYVFCGYMLIRVTNHPTYAAPFVVLPMLLLGMEKTVAKRGSLLFPAAVLLGFWSNYYFMYICSIGLLVYALLRYPEIVKEKRVRRFPGFAGKLILYYLTGLLMAMATFLPAMLRYRDSIRTSQTSAMQSLLLYADKRRYAAWFLNLISPYQSSGNGLDLNFAVIVLPALAILMTKAFRKYRVLRISLILELVALLVPLFGYVFAGMNNENNRWIFLIAFSLGMCCVRTIDTFGRLTRKQAAVVCGAGILFFMAVSAEHVLGIGNRYNDAGALELLALLLLMLLLNRKKCSRRTIRLSIFAAAFLSVCAGGILTYSISGGGRIKAFRDAGNTTGAYDALDRKIASEIPDDSFYRVDAANVTHGMENSAEYHGYNSIGIYNSILNTAMVRDLMDENNAGLDAVTQIHDLDGRTVAENLAHVKYYLASGKTSGLVPFGYSPEPVMSRDGISVYENQNLLSSGFTSGNFITWEQYQKLTDIEKEMVKLDAVVLPEGAAKLEEQVRKAGLKEVTKPSAAVSAQKLDLPDIGEDPCKISLAFSAAGNTCSFLRLEGLKGASDYETMEVISEGIKNFVSLRGNGNVYTVGRTDYLLNLGFNQEDRSRRVDLKFSGEGVRELKGAEIISVSMDGYEDKIACLNRESLTDEKITDGLLTGKISVSESRLAVFSVAAANGWELQVDGNREETAVLDGMYIGTMLKPGEHEIRLVYRTPGLRTGILLACAGIAVFILLAALQRRQRRRRRIS